MEPKRPDHRQQRFDREFKRVARFMPGMDRLRSPRWRITRKLAAAILITGGVLGILPFLGFWMIPLGLLLLAIDIPALQGPVTSLTIRGRRWTQKLRHRIFGK